MIPKSEADGGTKDPELFLFRKAVRGIPKPKDMKASPIKVPMILKKVGGAPNPSAVHSPIITAKPIKPKMDTKNNMKSGGRVCIANCLAKIQLGRSFT